MASIYTLLFCCCCFSGGRSLRRGAANCVNPHIHGSLSSLTFNSESFPLGRREQGFPCFSLTHEHTRGACCRFAQHLCSCVSGLGDKRAPPLPNTQARYFCAYEVAVRELPGFSGCTWGRVPCAFRLKMMWAQTRVAHVGL